MTTISVDRGRGAGDNYSVLHIAIKRTKDEEKSLACDLSPYWYDPINTKFSF